VSWIMKAVSSGGEGLLFGNGCAFVVGLLVCLGVVGGYLLYEWLLLDLPGCIVLNMAFLYGDYT
jgi:hypothetical protein